MLRAVVLAFGGLCFAGGLIAFAFGAYPPAVIAMIWGAILVVGTVYDRFRYKPVETTPPGPGWMKTTEKFVDDETGTLVTVYIRPETGERSYVQRP
jgi:hypothetical protein